MSDERKFAVAVDWSVNVQPAPEETPEVTEDEFKNQYEQRFVCNPENKGNDNG